MNERTKLRIRDGLLFAAINNLKEFGYPGVNKVNILTDMLYSRFFKSMLEDKDNITKNKDIEIIRLELLNELTEK